MDPAHMAFADGMNRNGTSAANMLNMPVHLAMSDAERRSLADAFDGLFTPCNPDSCLDNDHHFRQPRVSHKGHTLLALRTPQQQQLSPPSLDAQSYGYTWEQVLDESALGNSAVHHAAVPYCEADDCASECSSECDGSCPSQCGDTGQGVCCDDDACGSPQLCLDQDCQGARRPCMDESCLNDMTSDDHLSSGHIVTDGDKAAAAALTSFVGDGQLQVYGQAAFMPPPSSDAAQSRGEAPPLFHLPESLPCGNLSVESMLATGPPEISNQPLQMALEYALASHIMQYHDPSHGLAHTGNCLANDPAQLISRCTLPKLHANDGAADPYLSQLNGHECGFQVQDPNAFAQHIFQEHRPVLVPQSQMPRFTQFLPRAHAAEAPHQRRPRTGYSTASHGPFGQHFSPSLSPLTNFSAGQSISTTPSSLTTPSPLESGAGPAELSFTGDSRSPFGASKPQLPAQEDQFVCRWLTGHGDAVCGQRFDDDEQLQKHCKHEHLKQLKKAPGGFRCGWENCARNTCFTQRSKVERHMQVHTGYKPVRCEICGASLSAKQALDQHMRIHTGETPWVCKFPGCGCAFKQQSALTMHERTHTGIKPLECEICHKKFSESSNLSKHRRTHNVKGMHECQFCGKDFHRLDQLRRHMSTNHKDRAAEIDALLNKTTTKSQIQRVSKTAKNRAGAGGKPSLKAFDTDTLEMVEDRLQEAMMDRASL